MISRTLYCFSSILVLTLSGCSKGDQNTAQGYIEGDYTYITSPVSGVIQQITIDRGSQVKKGDVILALEKQPEIDAEQAAKAALDQAIANLASIKATLVYSKVTYERYQTLVPKKAIEESQLDNAKANYVSQLAQLDQATAAVEARKADVGKSSWEVTQKTIKAPFDAMVFDIYYRLGEYTVKNEPILSLLAPQNIKVIFYVPEPVLRHIQVGGKIHVNQLAGKISFISPSAEYTPPVIFSNETNYKLVYRIEGSFAAKDAVKLHPGQPVNVAYDTDE